MEGLRAFIPLLYKEMYTYPLKLAIIISNSLIILTLTKCFGIVDKRRNDGSLQSHSVKR